MNGHSVDARSLQAKEQTKVMAPVRSSSPGCQHQGGDPGNMLLPLPLRLPGGRGDSPRCK